MSMDERNQENEQSVSSQKTQNEPGTPQVPQPPRRSRFSRVVNKRNAIITAIGVIIAVLLLAIAAFLYYRIGYADQYIANSIVGKFKQYGIKAEIGSFKTTLSPYTAELKDIKLYDEKTKEFLGKVDRIYLTFTIIDLLAPTFSRNIRFETIEFEKPEIWVKFDKDGNSNFRNIRIEQAKSRLTLDFLAAKTKVNNALIHFDDQQHTLSGEGRNVVLLFEAEDATLAEDERRFKFDLKSENSSFVYDGKPVDNISVTAKGIGDRKGANIQELVLRTPLAESTLSGNITDWQKMSYAFDIKSTVDLTQASDVFQLETPLRGVGNFSGKVTGEGSKYNVEGEINSEALAADNIRLKALKVNATGRGEGSSYEANGKAIADLLTVGDYQFNYLQLIGNVYGTGTDFRWLGEMHSAAAKVPGGATIAGLIVYDAVAEKKAEEIDVTAKRGTAKEVKTKDATVTGVQVNDIRSKTENGTTNATIANGQAAQAKTKDLTIKGIKANGIKILNRDNGPADVDVSTVHIDGIEGLDAKVGSLNVAGVRLGIYKGRIEGSTKDIDVGTVALDKTKQLPSGGKIENVKLTKPVFVLEPNDRYRASADLSLGGGVLGSVNLGAARANLTLTNSQVEVKNFTASIMDGSAQGNAVINTERGASRVDATFNDLDIGKLATLFAGQVVPLSGKTNGEAKITFRGTDIKNTATGNIRATFNAEAGDEARGRTPLNGVVDLNAANGLFDIARAELSSAASRLVATGKFSFAKNDSDLNLNLTSTDATELQRIVSATGILGDPDSDAEKDQIAKAVEENKIVVAGNLAFTGNLRGQLDDPTVTGRASVDSFFMQERELGSLAMNINLTPETLDITDGQLSERDGGGITFAVNKPRKGTDNITVDATLDKANMSNLAAVLPGLKSSTRDQLATLKSDLSGKVNVTGLPENMNGNANLNLSRGTFQNESFDSITAKATFSGTAIKLEEVDARLDAGRVVARGTIDPTNFNFNLEAESDAIQLEKINNLTARLGGTSISGTFNLKARVTGNLKENDFTTLNLNVDGESNNARINDRDIGKLTLTARTENNQINASFTTNALGNPQSVTAVVNLRDKRLPTTIQSNLSNADLSLLFAALMPPNSVQVTGRTSGAFNAKLELYGENTEGEEGFGVYNLSGSANFTEMAFTVGDIPFSAVTPLAVQLTPTEVIFDKARFTGPGTNVSLDGRASIAEGGQNNLALDGSVNLRLLNALSPNMFFNGVTEVAIRVMGSHTEQRVTGSANLNGASFATLVGTERLTLSNMRGRALFNANQIQIDSVTGNLGGGNVSLTGGVLLDGLSPSAFRFSVRGDKITVPFPTDFRTTADAQIEINSSRRGSRQTLSTIIAGRLNVIRSEYRQNIDVADLINQRVEGSLTEGSGSTSSLIGRTQLDLYLEGRDALVVNNNLADMVGSIALRVTGPIDSPIISGRITSTRGYVKFRDQRYELQRAIVDIPAQRNPDPLLNVNAETEVRGYTLFVTLTGSLSQPSASVRSDPPLPQADVVSLITTGDLSSGDAGLFSTSQPGIATAANLLADTLIAAPARRATDKLFGLSRFELEPVISERGASPTARLTVGRQITKDLSIAYSTNLTADKNQVLALEYRVSNRISFVAQYEQGSVTGINTNSNNFSFEIKFRKRF